MAQEMLLTWDFRSMNI